MKKANKSQLQHTCCTATNFPQCEHKNGWYMTATFWIFEKRYFVCSDCGKSIQVKNK